MISKNKITSIANNLQFDLVGFADATELIEESVHFKEWLAKGYHAGMSYMERNIEKRFDVTNILTISCKYLMPPLSNKTWILKHESQTRDMYYKCSIYSQFY